MKTFRLTFLLCSLCGVFCSLVAQQQSLPVEQKISILLAKLTLEEKIELLGGTGFATKSIARLGIPSITMTDGPVGVRCDQSTTFPVSVALASSWDTALVRSVGRALALEAKAKNKAMLLGPCIGMNRVPHGGRNFETFGEDPFLNGRMAVAYIRGVQGEGIITSTKHYALNNQEHEREKIDVRADERTMHEIYLPPFKAAVQEGGTWTVMASYNKINGAHASENNYLLNDVLKNLFHFNGFVVSDWGATHSTVNAANNGLDLEMPEGEFFNTKTLLPAIKGDSIKESTIDDKVRRLLRVMFMAGMFDSTKLQEKIIPNGAEQQRTASEAARAGIVLLKNEKNILPLSGTSLKSIALIGPSAAIARTGGGGSSMVTPFSSVSPLEAIQKKIGGTIHLSYAQGCLMEGDITPIPSNALFLTDSTSERGLYAEFFENKNLIGTPSAKKIDSTVNFDWSGDAPLPNFPKDNFSIRWKGKLKAPVAGQYTLSTASDDGVRLYVDGKLVINDWNDHAIVTNSCSVEFTANTFHDIVLEYYENGGGANVKLGWTPPGENILTKAVEAAKNADVAIVCVGTSFNIESEGADRKSLALPAGQDELIQAISAVNKNTIVVLQNGAPLLMQQWIADVPAIVEAWFDGQDAGSAIVDVLFGDVNPSGKLPVSFVKRWEDSPAFGNYPGANGSVEYKEGIFMGYRGLDKNNVEPLFPFGHGLSYTTFTYSNLAVTSKQKKENRTVTATLNVKNTGARDGAEVVQVYVNEVKPSVERPPKELKAFQKVFLKAGETKRLTFTLDNSALAFYDVKLHNWKVNAGEFSVMVGSSSRDIRAEKKFRVK